MIDLALLELTNIPRAVRINWLENAIHVIFIQQAILTHKVCQTDSFWYAIRVYQVCACKVTSLCVRLSIYYLLHQNLLQSHVNKTTVQDQDQTLARPRPQVSRTNKQTNKQTNVYWTLAA